jgi:ankyrin repeat protein
MKFDQLLAAVYRGDKAALARGVSAENVNSVDESGRTLLMNAVLEEPPNSAIIQLLFDRGADPNVADNKGWTALHFAAQARNADVVRTLLQAGANPDPRDEAGCTPLWRSLKSNPSSEVVQALLDAGADPKAQDKWGSSSPLSIAKEAGKTEIVELMLRSGESGPKGDSRGAE